jgi:hypothetical protein
MLRHSRPKRSERALSAQLGLENNGVAANIFAKDAGERRR